jgi:hypothetical protein
LPPARRVVEDEHPAEIGKARMTYHEGEYAYACAEYTEEQEDFNERGLVLNDQGGIEGVLRG